MIRDDVNASLTSVCLHEHAHLAVARALGASGFVRIRRVLAADDAPQRYAGSFQMHGELVEREWRIVALAGAVAECLGENAAADFDAVRQRLDGERPMLTGVDAELAGRYTDADLATCVDLVRQHWSAIRSAAGEHVTQLLSSRGQV